MTGSSIATPNSTSYFVSSLVLIALMLGCSEQPAPASGSGDSALGAVGDAGILGSDATLERDRPVGKPDASAQPDSTVGATLDRDQAVDQRQPDASDQPDSTTQASPDASPSTYIFQQDFEGSPQGVYTREQMRKDFAPDLEHHSDPAANCTVVADPIASGRGQVLKVRTRAGELHSGFHGYMPLHHDYEELYFAYDIYFPVGFDFGKGAKIPSLASKHWVPSGSLPNFDPNDCKTRIPDGTDRWTAGMMWHDLNRTGRGNILTYAYHINQPCYGSSDEWTVADGSYAYLETGAWHRIELRVKLGAVQAGDPRNDLVQGWFDGQLVFEKRYTYRLPGGEDLFIGKIALKHHYGGGQDWAPNVDSVHYYDNFRVSTAPITYAP